MLRFTLRAYTLPLATALPITLCLLAISFSISHAQEGGRGGQWIMQNLGYQWGNYEGQYERVMYLNGKTDREIDGYKGKVKSVKMTMHSIEDTIRTYRGTGIVRYTTKGLKTVETRDIGTPMKMQDEAWTYNEGGYLISYYDSVYKSGRQFTLDSKNRIAEETQDPGIYLIKYYYNDKGFLEKRLYWGSNKEDDGGSIYAYDKSKRIQTISDYYKARKDYKITFIKYDSRGSIARIEEYGMNNDSKYYVSSNTQCRSYNKQGNMVERYDLQPDKSKLNEEIWTYDSSENLQEYRQERYANWVHKYINDEQGNWITENRYEIKYKYGKEALTLKYQVQRDISYYE